MNGETIYFISDAHLGAPFADAVAWEKSCIEFLRMCREKASALYILGDLFDFWIEYPRCIRADYFPVVHELAGLIQAGIPVHAFAGNHDFAFGPFVTRTLGMTVHPGPADLVLQGRRVHLFHGDGLLRSDVGYRLLKPLLRNRACRFFYTLLPPIVGIPLGTFCSGTSRLCGEGFMTEARVAEYREHARSLLDNGYDIVFFAHTHRAELSRWAEKTYCNTGAWMRDRSFATMNGGQVRLWRYRTAAAPEAVSPDERNSGSSKS